MVDDPAAIDREWKRLGKATRRLINCWAADQWAHTVAELRAQFSPLPRTIQSSFFDELELDPDTTIAALKRDTANAIYRLWARGDMDDLALPPDFPRLLDTVVAYHNRINIEWIAPCLAVGLSRMDIAHTCATIWASDLSKGADGFYEIPVKADPVKAGRVWYHRLRRRYHPTSLDMNSDFPLTGEQWILALLQLLPGKSHRPSGK